jgi:hypothetical protein
MDDSKFVSLVCRYVRPALQPFGFSVQTAVSGRTFSAEFISKDLVVSIAYEPGDDYLLVAIFTVDDGIRSNIDDRIATPRLSDLNSRFLQASDADELTRRRYDGALGPEERRMQRIGAELAIVLPRYLQSLGKNEATGPALR